MHTRLATRETHTHLTTLNTALASLPFIIIFYIRYTMLHLASKMKTGQNRKFRDTDGDARSCFGWFRFQRTLFFHGSQAPQTGIGDVGAQWNFFGSYYLLGKIKLEPEPESKGLER